MNNIKLSPRAGRELTEAVDYLIERSPAAAVHFADTLENTLQALSDFPKIGRVTERVPFRALTMKTFPYKIFYRLDGDLIIIESVFHTSQNPDKI